MESFEHPQEACQLKPLPSRLHLVALILPRLWAKSGRDNLSLQELILVVPRTQDVQTSLAINWPCAAGIDVVSLDRRTPANEKKG